MQSETSKKTIISLSILLCYFRAVSGRAVSRFSPVRTVSPRSRLLSKNSWFSGHPYTDLRGGCVLVKLCVTGWRPTLPPVALVHRRHSGQRFHPLPPPAQQRTPFLAGEQIVGRKILLSPRTTASTEPGGRRIKYGNIYAVFLVIRHSLQPLQETPTSLRVIFPWQRGGWVDYKISGP